MLTATVYGKPASQGSKRLVGATTGYPRMIDADPRLKSWRAQLQAEMRAAAQQRGLPAGGWQGAVRLTVLVIVPRPRAHYRTGRRAGELREAVPQVPASGTDVDKVARGVCDAGTGIWWRDDRQVAVLTVERQYGAEPQVRVMAQSLSGGA